MKSLLESFPRNRMPLWIGIAVVVLAVLTARTIVAANPYLWIAILLVILGLAVTRSHVLGLYLIAMSVFFADGLSEMGLIPSQVSWIPEIVIILLFFKSLLVKPRRVNSRFFLLFIPFLVVSLLSIVVNFGQDHVVTLLFGFRTLFRFIVLFYALQVLPMEDSQTLRFIKFLLFLLILQIPVSVVKLFIYGQGELAIGTYAMAGGLYSTILPLIGISFFFGLFYFFKRKLRYILYCIGFVAFGVIGGKRAILFLAPLLVVYLFISVPRGSLRLRTRALSYSLLAILLILSIWAPLRFLNTLRDDPIGYAMNYEFATSGDQSIGRMSTSIGVFNALTRDMKTFLVGFGPGSFHESFWPEYEGRVRRDVGSYGFLYGVTGLSFAAIEFGYLGAILFLLPIGHLYLTGRRFLRRTDDPYWKAMAFSLCGIVFASVVIYVVYGDFYNQDIPPFIMYFLAAVILKKQSQALPAPAAGTSEEAG